MAAQHVPAPNHPFRISQPGRPQHYSRRSRRTRHGRSACTACGAGRSSPTAGPLASFTGCCWCVVRCVPARWAGRLFTSLDSRPLPPPSPPPSFFQYKYVFVWRARWCVNELPSLQCARSPRLLGSSVPAWFGFAPLRRYRRLCAPPFNVTDETGCLYGLSFGQSFPSSITWPKEKRCVMHCMWSSRYSLGEHMHACPKYQCGGMV